MKGPKSLGHCADSILHSRGKAVAVGAVRVSVKAVPRSEGANPVGLVVVGSVALAVAVEGVGSVGSAVAVGLVAVAVEVGAG